MLFPLININTDRSVSDKIRLCFWLYLLLLILEGAMRKWFLPQLTNLFLVVREPIVLYVLFLSFKYNICRDKILKVLFVFSFVSFLLTLLFGHHNILVALYGVRISLLHLPSIFIFAKVISREDIHLIGKAILYISVLMFVIIIVQYFSPQTSWINVGTGGQGTASFGAIKGYMRPSGTFSFTSGLVEFELLVGLFLFYYLYNNNNINNKYKISKSKISLFIIVYFFSVVLCLSRTIIFEVLLMFMVMVAYMVISRERISKIIYISLIVILSLYFLSYIETFNLAFKNVFIRFESASKFEGDVIEGSLGNRYLGSFYRAFFDTQNFSGKDIPFFGFGLGITTRVGETILGIRDVGRSFVFAEEEWSRIICEIGLFQGIVFLLGLRLVYPIYLVVKAFKYIKKRKDVFLYLSITPFLIYMISGQWLVPTTLGFTVVICTLFMAALNQNCYLSKNQY